jgi:hypothetical protein
MFDLPSTLNRYNRSAFGSKKGNAGLGLRSPYDLGSTAIAPLIDRDVEPAGYDDRTRQLDLCTIMRHVADETVHGAEPVVECDLAAKVSARSHARSTI